MTGDMHVKHIKGNNAAILCPACEKPYLFSEFIDKKGAVCPHCKKSITRFDDGVLSVSLIDT